MSTNPMERLNAALEGRYEIERELGEGGMATVYLAKDLKHNRNVALKVLKPELAAVVGAERFLAEIETTANLQHPNILPLFDSGEADSFLFYVMPYVEGETLRERIEREKQLPVDEAVRIASDIAEALDHAHRQGVVHRDIKPANVLLRDGRPLVADFGIALAVGAAGGARLTETGLSVGTPFYMSPEQATGDQQVGPPGDTYALAAVLYEMLVGEPPYLGNTAQAVLGKIIQGAPVSATAVRKSIPANVDAAIRKALEKIPADRFSGAQDFARALADPGFRHGEVVATSATAGSWKPLALGFGAISVLLAAAFGATLLEPEPTEGVLRYAMPIPVGLGGGSPFGSNMAISRDGSKLAIADMRDGTPQVWLRERDQLAERAVSGTEGARQPFFSPDGQRVAFITTGREIKVASLGGEPPLTLADTGLVRGGGSWGEDGYIYFTRGTVVGGTGLTLGLGRVPATGGAVEIVTVLDSTQAEVGHMFADALPNGRGVLFSISRERLYDASTVEVAVADLSTGEHRVLLQGVMARWSPTGHILVVREDGALLAAPFDDNSLEVTGPAIPLLEGVDIEGQGSADLVLSENGTLAYVAGSSQGSLLERELVWVSRSGGVQEIDPGWRGVFHFPRISPEGDRLSLAISEGTDTEVWIKQLDQGPLSKLTFQGPITGRANWHPDGRSLVFRSNRAGNSDLYSRRADGSAQTELLLDEDIDLNEVIYSPDGEWLVYRLGTDLFAQRVGTDEPPVALATEEFPEGYPAISPDGRWLAYVSMETGTAEVYVRPFPNTGDARWQVSAGGGIEPAWAHSGREIFYRSLDQELISVEVLPGSTFIPGDSRALFSVQPFLSSSNSRFYDVDLDDSRFVMIRNASDENLGQIVVVEGFFEELLRRADN